MVNLINYIYNRSILKIFKDSYGKKLHINGAIYRRGRGQLIIGDNVTINSSKKSNFLGGDDYTTIYVNKGKTLRIGSGVGISNSTIICYENINIEDNVFIGADVKIYDTDFHCINYNKRISIINDIPVSKPILIKNGAFIGAHSIILKGVTIGEHSIIGAGSVVTKNIPNNEIWAGNPAKFIRKIDEEINEKNF